MLAQAQRAEAIKAMGSDTSVALTQKLLTSIAGMKPINVLCKRMYLLASAMEFAKEYISNIESILEKHSIDDYNDQKKHQIIIAESRDEILTLAADLGADVSIAEFRSGDRNSNKNGGGKSDDKNDNDTPTITTLSRVIKTARIFELLDTIANSMQELLRIVFIEEYLDKALLNRSRTWASQLQNTRSTMIIRVSEMKTLEPINNDNLIHDMYDCISSDITPEVFDIIISSQSSNFIVYLAKYMLNDISPNDQLRFIKRANSKKDEVLKSPTFDLSAYALPQRLISMHGLYPITTSMNIADIIKIVKKGVVKGGAGAAKSNNNVIADIKKLLALADSATGVIVLDKSGYNPIEYNLQTLIDVKYVLANNQKTSPAAGINNTSVARYRTIMRLDDMRLNTSTSTSASIHQSIKQQTHVFIFETINNMQFRIVGEKFGQYRTPIGIAYKLVEPITPRPQVYNKIMEDLIIPKLDNTQQRIDAYPGRVKIFKSFDGIISQIIERLVSKYTEHITAAEVNSPETALNALKLQHELIIRTTNYIIGKEMDLDTLNDEFRVGFALSFDTLVFELNKKFTHIVDHYHLPPLIFKEYKDADLYKYLVGMYRSMIEKMFAELNEYPSVFDGFEMPLKVYVDNKKVFMH